MGLNGESHVCKSPISNHFSLKTTPKEKKIKKLSKNLTEVEVFILPFKVYLRSKNLREWII